MFSGVTLQNAVIDFVEKYSIELNLQEKTVKNKRNAMKRLLRFLGDKPFTLENVREYTYDLNKNGWDAGSVKAEIKIIKAFSHFLVKRDYMTENFGKELIYPKTHKKPLQLIS